MFVLRKSTAFVRRGAAVLVLGISMAVCMAGSSDAAFLLKYVDDLYDIAKTTLRISMTKGDDLVKFFKTTDKLDDVVMVVSKLPKFKVQETILEIAALRGTIKKTDIFKIRGLLAGVDDCDTLLLHAFRRGDDLFAVAAKAAASSKSLSFWGKLGEGASSTILRSNMIRSGIKAPSFPTAAHHIVAGQDKAAHLSRLILEKYRVGLNGAANGVFLPAKGAAKSVPGLRHVGSHKAAYHEWVYGQLQHAQSREEVVEILNIVRSKLLSGKVPQNIW